MRKCPNCTYLWPDHHVGSCTECGNPMVPEEGAGSQAALGFAWARQTQGAINNDAQEGAMRRGNYDGVQVEESLLQTARGMIVQREEVRYESDS